MDSATDRIWWNVEMPQLLDSTSKVTTINGVSAEQFRNTYYKLGGADNRNALDTVNREIANTLSVDAMEHNDAELNDSNPKNESKEGLGESEIETEAGTESKPQDTGADTKP